jgi:hypothetical protein
MELTQWSFIPITIPVLEYLPLTAEKEGKNPSSLGVGGFVRSSFML